MRKDADGPVQTRDPAGSGEPLVQPKVLRLEPAQYPGGIAIWGALAAVYDTTGCPPDQGVHVHARMRVGGRKSIDETFDAVEVIFADLGDAQERFRINGDDASHYNIGTILKRKLKYLRCPSCRHVHSDKGWYSVNPHLRHRCEQCAEVFADTEPSISNPVMLLKELLGNARQERTIIDPVGRRISVRQAKYPGGVQLWGSNPAVLWTSPKHEEGGIHFHGFFRRGLTPTADETFGALDIDGIVLDPEMTRHLMAQQALPFLLPHLAAVSCPHCRHSHFDRLDLAVTPHTAHLCEECDCIFTSDGPIISNPMIQCVSRSYQLFRELFPDVALERRRPWDHF